MTSKIKVDNINKVSDDSNIIKKCGSTTTVGSGAGNTVVVCGSTVTIGRCGGTVALASGSTQTGFGRTGTVDWQTSIKTSATFSASNGEGYFVDTSSNAVTANLPAGSVGAIVAFKDYAQNFDTNALTISANGSDKIEGLTSDLTLDVKGLATTLVFGDATKGWQSVNSNEVTNTVKFVAATGGTITTVCTNFKVHTFTGPGTFQVTCAGNAGGSNTVSYMVVAGGGGGPRGVGGGSGGGGFREGKATSDSYTSSPLACTSGANAGLPVSAINYPITVGSGGSGSPGSPGNGTSGNTSTFSTITSAGGGRGSRTNAAESGGSGGGAYIPNNPTYIKGSGNTPPVSPPQGNPGGEGNTGPGESGGGGGGAGAVGGNGSTGCNPSTGGPGGNGVSTQITGSAVTRAGGGGGSGFSSTGGAGGSGGGGDSGPGRSQGSGSAGTANTGGGGGSGNYAPGTPAAGIGGNGGSGIVVIRYKFQ